MSDHSRSGLARVAHVDHLQLRDICNALAQGVGGQPRCDLDVGPMGEHHLVGILEVADHPVETDSGETVLTLEFLAGIGQQHDVDIRLDHRAGEFGVATLEADVDGALQMSETELLGVAAVDQHRTGGHRRAYVGVGHRGGHLGLVEQFAALPVEDRVVDEVARCRRLTFGDEFHEGLLVRCAQRVVGLALLAHGRPEFGRQVLAAGRTGTVGGIHPGGVRQGHQLGVQRIVELVGQFIAGEADRREQIGAADVADEQGVTGQHAVGHGVTGVLVDDDAHRLRGVAGGVAELQLEFTQ